MQLVVYRTHHPFEENPSAKILLKALLAAEVVDAWLEHFHRWAEHPHSGRVALDVIDQRFHANFSAVDVSNAKTKEADHSYKRDPGYQGPVSGQV